MAHGYGYFTFGWLEAEREFARIDKFNAKWQRLTRIHGYLQKDFLNPISAAVEASDVDIMTPREFMKLWSCENLMNFWHNDINSNINIARLTHLSKYATSIKATALKAIGLCQKCKIYPDIASYGYEGKRKCVVLNGNDLYYLG